VNQKIYTIREKKKAVSKRITVELAILATVAIHVAMSLLVVEKKSKTNHYLNTQKEYCQYLNLNLDRTPSTKKFIQELKVLDPTLLSLPNELFGFSLVRALPRKLPYTKNQPYDLTIKPIPENKFPYIPLTTPFLKLKQQIIKQWQIVKPTTIKRIPPPKLPNKLLWRLSDGTIINNINNIKIENIQKCLNKKTPVTKPTTIEISNFNNIIRIRLKYKNNKTGSCGNPKLDAIAIETIKKQIRIQQLHRQKNIQPPNTLIPKEKEAIHIQVEWLLLSILQQNPKES